MTQAAPVYRVRSQEVWDLARDDYLSGEPARVVCRRYDLGLSAFRIRARKAKWRREDQDDPDLYDPAAELEAVEDIALSDMAVSARRRLQLALEDGEATEAMRWLKIFETLSSLAADAPDLDEVHGLHPVFDDAGSEQDEVHGLHPVFTPPAASPPSPPPNRAERRRLRRADRRKPISASGDGRASQGP
ncbi:MAG: hypothetical protein P0Y50_00770 [Candidatus Brevundimonas colombiensis]|uniref:Uncharacterized protein n=1 Tax=Candidatus Brevundimonas colombiensis TaxID=3121376 RepID=A0AAJ5X0F8_9CAUL|nr:hypothetical protein [Brevundimonas sp.]WEK40165.1 MAG: hypothetical protein P0Y50_00770 [Brevundimonas sp.]